MSIERQRKGSGMPIQRQCCRTSPLPSATSAHLTVAVLAPWLVTATSTSATGSSPGGTASTCATSHSPCAIKEMMQPLPDLPASHLFGWTSHSLCVRSIHEGGGTQLMISRISRRARVRRPGHGPVCTDLFAAGLHISDSKLPQSAAVRRRAVTFRAVTGQKRAQEGQYKPASVQ